MATSCLQQQPTEDDYLPPMKEQNFIDSSANCQDSVNTRFLNFRGTTARTFKNFFNYFETSPFSTIINSKYSSVMVDWILNEVCYWALHWFWSESLGKGLRCYAEAERSGWERRNSRVFSATTVCRFLGGFFWQVCCYSLLGKVLLG